MFHSVLFEDDLLKLTCMHKKVFRSFCNRLMEDRLIVTYSQKEETNANGGSQYRWLSRVYYYIHYIEAIDAIKWKVHCIVKQVKDEIGQFNDPQGYVCPTCHAKYSLLDVPSMLSEDKMRFECSICGDTLIEDDTDLEAQKGQEKLERLMAQLEPIIESLKKIDTMKVEDNNFESALIKAIPASSSSTAMYTVSNRAGKRKKGEPDTSEATRRTQATIHVSITADDEELKRERIQREKRNEKLRQNALPSWHMESAVGQGTVGVLHADAPEPTEEEGKEKPAGKANGTEVQVKSEPEEPEKMVSSRESNATHAEIKAEEPPSTSESHASVKAPEETAKSSSSATTEELNALTAYYAQLRKRQAEEEEQEEDEEEDDDDEGEDDSEDDEDEFEAFEEAEAEENNEGDEKENDNDNDKDNDKSDNNDNSKDQDGDVKMEDSQAVSDEDEDDKPKKPVADATAKSDEEMDEDDIDDAIFEEMENESS